MNNIGPGATRPQHPWLRVILENTLPLALRGEYLVQFDLYRGRSMVYQMGHSAALLGGAYRVLFKPAFKSFTGYAVPAELVLITYCFLAAAATSSKPRWLLVPLGSILCALSLRDIWWHPGRRRARVELRPVQNYYLHSTMDAACAGVFLIQGQTFAQYFAPAVALPNPVLFRGAAICLPMVSTLRMLLRPMPDPRSPFEGRGMSAAEIFRATFRLNILWAVTFNLTVMMGASDIPGYFPDVLRGFLPLFVMVLWVAVQRDSLERRNYIQKLFAKPEEQVLARYKEMLPQGLKPGDPFYWAYIGLKWLIFAGFALCLEAAVRPWLLGSSKADSFVMLGNLMGFAVVVLTWRYVEKANRVAVEALQEDIERLRAARAF